MDRQLKHARDLVALEAYVVSDLSGLIQRIFPSVKGGLDGFKGMFSQEPAVALTGNEKSFLNTVEKRSYPNMMPLTAFVPEGLKVTYLEYSAALYPGVEHARGSVAVIDEFAVFLAMLVSNRSSILETATRKKQYAELMLQRERVNKDIQACFNDTTRTTVKVEDVVKRNADWKPALEAANGLTKSINLIERSHLSKKVNECSELLDRISRLVNENYFDKVSPEVLLDLSDGAYQVAAELEFYSIMYYRVQAYAHAVSRTMEHVESVQKAA